MLRRPLAAMILLAALTPFLASCEEDVTTTAFPITHALPQQEEARYGLFDSKGNRVGSGVLTIAGNGPQAQLGIAYDFGNGQTDVAAIQVQRDSVKPIATERTVKDGGTTYTTRTEFSPDKVRAAFDDGGKSRTREASLTGDAYDNTASLFLWRTIELAIGKSSRYINVVVDPRHGTITRAIGSLDVSGREELQLPSGPVLTWRVRFTSAGVTNTAWYRDDEAHTLVKYEITRGPTLILESIK